LTDLPVSPRRRQALAGLAFLPLAAPANAQSAWPAKPIRWICPYAVGGPSDIVSRVFAVEMARTLGQQVVVENRPGANANIGAEVAAKAVPDGYTVFMGTGSTHGINPAIYPKLAYDPVRDFAPVSLLTESMLFLVVNNELPVRSVRELIDYARANPGRLSYGSVGNGSAHHLAMEMFKLRTRTFLVHIPYRGSAPAIQDLIAGRIQVMFDASSAPQIRAGTVRGLATASMRRWPQLPDLPALAEVGMPDFHVGGWFGLFAPAGTPKAVIDRLAAEVARIQTLPEVRQRIAGMGLNVLPGGPDEAAKWVAAEMAKWPPVAKASGARADD
jgi:tripartite-type tricarboxylate transporter receptor subunit TctC